jgi:hypothetical protein
MIAKNYCFFVVSKENYMANYPVWQAPSDFKPFWLEVLCKTDSDGLLGKKIKCTRYIGNYNPEAPEKKKRDVASYDEGEVYGVLSRLSMTTYVTNVQKRLPPDTMYQLVIRVGKRAADNTLTTSFKTINKIVKTKTRGGKVKTKVVTLERSDVQFRLFRKSARILPSAFSESIQPPKPERKSVKAEE